MYRIIKMDGTELGITESVTYIKIGASGSFACSTKEDAIGVAFNSEPYNLVGHSDIVDVDTVIVCKIDNGEYVMQQDKVMAQNAANIDYLSMMAGIDLPEDEDTEDDISSGDTQGDGEEDYDDTMDDPDYVADDEEDDA